MQRLLLSIKQTNVRSIDVISCVGKFIVWYSSSHLFDIFFRPVYVYRSRSDRFFFIGRSTFRRFGRVIAPRNNTSWNTNRFPLFLSHHFSPIEALGSQALRFFKIYIKHDPFNVAKIKPSFTFQIILFPLLPPIFLLPLSTLNLKRLFLYRLFFLFLFSLLLLHHPLLLLLLHLICLS